MPGGAVAPKDRARVLAEALVSERGEASGAAVALLILRAALACHTGMATFAQAGVSDKPGDEEKPRAAG